MFAIDSLRQLSFKFLEKPELNDFNFQGLFLRPFDEIMKNPKSDEDVRELVLRCVDNMIRSLSNNFVSGWKVLFSILAQSSLGLSLDINKLGLAILQRILDEHTDILCCRYGSISNNNDDAHENIDTKRQNADAEDFVSLCKASLSFIPLLL
jgi:brefeldin A-inhibited guanine nucleotide-exchange protein